MGESATPGDAADNRPLAAAIPSIGPKATSRRALPAIELRLDLPRRHRYGWGAIAGVIALMVLFVVPRLIAAALTPSLGAAGQAVRLGVALVLGWLGTRAVVLFLTLALVRTPRLVVDPDGLIAEHAGLFPKPLSLSRASISMAAVGHAETGPLSRSHAALPSLTGTVTAEPRPNLVVLFHNPVWLTTVRRGLAAIDIAFDWPGPARKQMADGVVAAVEDPARAEHAFSDWGVLVPLEEAAAAVRRLGRDDRSEQLRRLVVLAVGVLVFVVIGLALVASGRR